LLGGIGSGKNTLAALLADVGAAVIDADALNDEQLRHPDVVGQLKRWWGPSVQKADGTVDRSILADLIFSDDSKRRQLEGFLHPRITLRREELQSAYQRDPRYGIIVINSPLLLEVGLDRICDALVFIETDRDRRLERVRTTRGWSEAELDRRENLQYPLDTKRNSADYVVDNNACLDRLRSQVQELYPKLLGCDPER